MSLRLRLALWYGVLTGLIVLLAGTLAYAIHSRSQYDSLDRALEGAVEHVAGAHEAVDRAHELESMLATPIRSYPTSPCGLPRPMAKSWLHRPMLHWPTWLILVR
ncbi:MAG: hypothetical protein M3220_04300 [Chloroflexota bacterium]|nr:hypothetical protein [Chloroflexota bacterium]